VSTALDADSKKMQRRERRILRRRGEILQEAKRAFLSRPYSEVTVEKIAAAADMSKATIYLYFRNKAQIYGAVLEEDMQILVEALTGAYDRKKGLRENLLSFSRRYVAYFRTHPEYFTTLSFFFLPGRELPLPTEIATGIERRFQTAMSVVEGCIRDAIERQEIRPCDTWQTTVALWSMWLGSTYLALSDRAATRFNDSLEQVVEVGVMTFFQGMANPVARPAKMNEMPTNGQVDLPGNGPRRMKRSGPAARAD
jgi:AcrR family transcriptional regulator